MIDILELKTMLKSKNTELQNARDAVKRLEDDVKTIESMMKLVSRDVPVPDQYSSFSEFLNSWLRDNKMTKEVLADLAGISRTSINNWESGNNQMSMKMKAVLANTLAKDGKTNVDDAMGILNRFFPQKGGKHD